MSARHFTITVSLIVAVAGLRLQAVPQTKTAKAPDPDEAAMHDYVLTVEKAAKYADVMKRFQQMGPDPGSASEMQKVQAANVYNVEKAAMMEKSPQIAALFKKLEFTPRDFVLLPLTVQTASFAASMPNNGGPKFAYVSPANIQFVKAHKDDLEKWGLQ
jgi:hypothetical protein